MFWTIVLAVIVGLILLMFVLRRLFGYHGLPPGPKTIPILGNALQISSEKPQETLAKWGKEFGGLYTFWTGPNPTIVLTDTKLIKEAFVKEGDNYAARPYVLAFDYFGGRYGLINLDGPPWSEQRRFVLRCLREFGFGKSLMEDRIMEQAHNLIHWFKEDVQKNKSGALDPHSHLQFCVGNIIWSLVLGSTFQRGDERLLKMLHAIGQMNLALASPSMTVLEMMPWLGYIPGVNRLFFSDENMQLFDTLMKVINQELERCKGELDETEEAENFTAAYLKEMRKREKDGDLGYFSEYQWAGVVTDLLIAGMDTSIATLYWGILLLIHHPDVQAKMRQEIDIVVGKDRNPSLADRSAMPYTMACIDEIQRVANIVPFNIPHTVHHDTQLKGYRIPKGVTILAQISALHMDPDLFPEPERFNPERFLEDGQKMKRVEGLMPFSIGKRACLGEGLARMELFLIFVTLVQKLEFSGVPDQQLPSLNPVFSITLLPKPYECLVTLRD